MNKENKGYIYIAAGGTAGHFFPAIGLAEEIVAISDYEVLIFHDKRVIRYIDADCKVSKVQLPLRSPGLGVIQRILFFLFLVLSSLIALYTVVTNRPIAVVGFGGYPSLPLLLAALATRTPIFLHEQNAVIGKVNKLFARYAIKVAISYEETDGVNMEYSNIVHTGNILRKKLVNTIFCNMSFIANKCNDFNIVDPIRILITGGSQGSGKLSAAVPEAIALLDDSFKARLIIHHQVRTEDIPNVSNAYRKASITAEVSAFFHDIDDIMLRSHIIICRSGASTVMEAFAYGMIPIFIPMESKDRHQYKNAQYSLKHKKGFLIEEKEFSTQSLYELILSILDKNNMGISAYNRVYDPSFVDNAHRFYETIIKHFC